MDAAGPPARLWLGRDLCHARVQAVGILILAIMVLWPPVILLIYAASLLVSLYLSP